MSINYVSGKLNSVIRSEAEYKTRLQAIATEQGRLMRLSGPATELGRLISSDPTDYMSDIGRRIFDHLDLPTAIAFSQVSRGTYERAKKSWFVQDARRFVFHYVSRDVKFIEYLKDGGWESVTILSLKVIGIGLTIGAGITAKKHSDRIPEDAPVKTGTYVDDNGNRVEFKYIDHPEAEKARNWTGVAIGAGAITATGIIIHGFYQLAKIDPDIFFTPTEKDISSLEKTNPLLKFLLPDYHGWKKKKLKANLIANPPNWKNHPQLREKICPLSGSFMLFPVQDKCGHFF